MQVSVIQLGTLDFLQLYS